MIQLSKNYSLPERQEGFIPIKIVSIGGAGLNALDRIVLDGLERADVVAINTDVQSLASSVAPHKVQLGRSVTRGLGAGGDPELGYQAAVESADEIREALADARMIFVCAGLGGGTGSGAAPYVAQLAHEAGPLVVAFAPLPFSFEGKRRNEQAHEALTQALKNPLMDRGRMLADAARVLVQVAGGPGMTLSEVEILMQELGRHISEQTQILFGAAVDGRLGDRLSVTIVSSLRADEDFIPQQSQPAQSSAPAMPPVWEQPHEISPEIEIESEPMPMEVFQPAEMTPSKESAPSETVPPPRVEPIPASHKPEPIVSTSHKKPAPIKEEKPSAEKSAQAKQEVLQFEPVTRGRFEKSEPTIVEGEDLDVPTYLRKKIKVK